MHRFIASLSIVCLIALAGTLGSERAAASPRSPGGSGGGSVVQGRIVEAFAQRDRNVHSLRGFDHAIDELRAIFPRWTNEQAKRLEKKTLFRLPRPTLIGRLPPEATQLYFPTENPCYQTPDEMYCDYRVETMPLPRLVEFFKHEVVIAAHLAIGGTGRELADVHAAVAELISPQVNRDRLGAVLSRRFNAEPDLLVPAEYVANIGQPPSAVALPAWAVDAKIHRCGFIAQATSPERAFEPRPLLEPPMNYAILVGGGLSPFNGYLYRARLRGYVSGDPTDLPASRQNNEYLEMTREFANGRSEALVFTCIREGSR